MCIEKCLDRKTYKVCRCLPLWSIFLTIAFLALCENALFVIDPIIILPTGIMTIAFLFGLCCRNSLQTRNCIWVTYLIISLVQLLVSLVIFGTAIMFPTEEECTEYVEDDGSVTQICIDIDSNIKLATTVLTLTLIGYFTLKTTFLVFFLHAYAR